MKQGQKVTNRFISSLLAMSVALLLAGCGGGGGGGSSNSGTTISGKVTLSSTAGGSTPLGKVSLQTKPRSMLASKMAHAKGKPFGKVMKGSPSSPSGKLGKVINRAVSLAPTLLSGTTVNLYDVDRPEWLYPVSTATTDSNGQFKLSALVNAAENGATYANGGSIPSGNYTLIAIGKDFSTSAVTTITYPFSDVATGKAYRNIIAIQAVVKKYTGDVTGNDLTAQSSDAIPQVVSIMGKKVGGLTTTTGGEYDLGTIATNAAIQVTFDMAMHRVSTPTAITLKDIGGTAVPGTWKMSADLTAATFYPTSALIASSKYKLSISSTATANYYGKGLKADVAAVYTAGASDSTPPNAIFVSPEVATGVDITTAIKIASNEAMDINTITVTSTPSIGSKPSIKSLGYTNVAGQYDYFYQIVPSDPLQLNTDYAITVSGGKDLAGNSMTSVTANFKTAASSSGVTGTGGSVADQSDVKSVVGKWVDSMNAGDLTLFSSMLSGDLTYAFVQDSASCNVGSPCTYDSNRDGDLSYSEFTKFIQNWFNDNSKIVGWTGYSDGVHLSGDVTGDILVDPSTGTAAFEFKLTYMNADCISTNVPAGCGTSYSGATIQPLYLVLKDINGAWYLSSLSDKDITGVVTASIGVITTVSPSNGTSMTQGTKAASFSWTPVLDATSYAVVVTDNSDPTGSTGWVGIIDGQSSSTLDFSVVADLDASDGKLVLIGGGLNAPFSKELKLQDGGSYTWMVIGFKSLTASTFISGTVAPDADVLALSGGDSFSIQGAVTTTLVVTPKTSAGTVLTFSDGLYAWDAASANSVTLDITGSSASTNGTVYVYGNNYAEKAFTFTNGKAVVSVDLFNGYNWIEVTDGVNWWYASTTQSRTTSASNYIYTTGGVSYNQLTVDTVTAGATALAADDYGYYNVAAGSTATTITLKGKASAGTVYIYNSAYDGVQYHNSSSSASVSNGIYTAVVDMYAGYNWLSVYDDYGNWTYVNIYNLGSGAVYQAPISNVQVNGVGPDGGTGTTYTVNTAANVTITGSVMTSGSGYWYQYNGTNYSSSSGTFTPVSNTINISVPTSSGYNYIDIYDYNGNWLGITINNQVTAVTQPNTITQIDGLGQTPQSGNYLSYDAGSNCSVVINGYSPASGYGSIYVYFYGYDVTGSISDYQVVTADISGNYTITQNVYSGTNYVDIYDINGNWQGVYVASACGSSAVVGLGVTGVIGSGGSITADLYGVYNTADQTVTIAGTAVSGKTITAYVYGGVASSTYTAIAASNTFTLSNLPIYSGYNYIDLTDGTNWYYVTVYTTGGATYISPISNVKVDGAAADIAGTVSDSWGEWDYVTASNVTLTGNATIDGTGTYYQYGNTTSTSGSFSISGGVFSLPISLENGWNYIYLYDAIGSYYGVTIYTSGSVNTVAKIVQITSPAHDAAISGPVQVTGSIDTASFTPVYVYGYVYDYTTSSYTFFSSDPYDQLTYGDSPLSYNSGTGAVSFNASVVGGDETYMELYAYDAGWTSHGHVIHINNIYGYAENFYKPSTKPTAKATRAKSHHKEFVKKMMRRKSR